MSNEFEETYSEDPAPEPAPAPAPKKPATQRRAKTSTAAKKSRSRRNIPPQLPWWIAGASLVVAAVIGIYFGVIRSTSPTSSSGGQTSSSVATANGKTGYRLAYPKGWKTVSPDTAAPGENSFAALKQLKGKGLVVMRVAGKVTLSASYLRTVEKQLKQGSSDYKFVASHTLRLKDGDALDVTYERTKLHEVRNLVVLPSGSISIVMDTVAPTSDTKTTSQIDQIVSSFQLTK